MKLKIVTVPCLADNYAFLVHHPETHQTAVVDVPETGPILAELERRNWSLDTILITHHHDDHIAGVDPLRDAYAAKVIGHKLDERRLPKLDIPVAAGEQVNVCSVETTVVPADGHTIGHIAYIMPGAAFTGDSLMALGCGKLFEGTAEMMWDTLERFAQLPDDTMIYSGHEYTASNAAFALTIEPDNVALQQRHADIKLANEAGQPTVPSELLLEKATNPFLRAKFPEIKKAVGMAEASDAAVFAEIRLRKDRF